MSFVTRLLEPTTVDTLRSIFAVNPFSPEAGSTLPRGTKLSVENTSLTVGHRSILSVPLSLARLNPSTRTDFSVEIYNCSTSLLLSPISTGEGYLWQEQYFLGSNQNSYLPSRLPHRPRHARRLNISTAKTYSSPVRPERHSIPAITFSIASRLPRKIFPFSTCVRRTSTARTSRRFSRTRRAPSLPGASP